MKLIIEVESEHAPLEKIIDKLDDIKKKLEEGFKEGIGTLIHWELKDE